MLKFFLTTALRQWRRHPGYSLINILGLAVGIACCLVILMYVRDELSFDKFHEKGERIYRIGLDRQYPGRSSSYAWIPHSYAEAIKAEFPEVEETLRLIYFQENNPVLLHEGRRFEIQHWMWADSTFFQVFSIPLLRGDPSRALTDPNGIVLTAAIAARLFGDQDPLGRRLRLAGGLDDLVVTGVCADVPEHSHLRFEVLVSTTNLPFLQEPNYAGFSAYTYLLLREGTDVKSLEAKFPDLVRKYAAGQIQRQFNVSYDEYIRAGNGYHYFLQPLRNIYLDSQLEGEIRAPGSRARVYIFTVIALFILLIAVINFMNLATAKSTERAREVGIRKTLGGLRGQLALQFLAEAVLTTLVATLLSLVLLNGLLSVFNELSGKEIRLSSLIQPIYLLALFGGALIVGILAGSYPAAVLSGFRPAAVLKGKLSGTRHGVMLRNGLVVFQFTISAALIISTLVVFRQMRYIRDKELGFDKAQVINIHGAFALARQTEAFKAQLRDIATVEAVGACSATPGGQYFGVAFRKEIASESVFGRGIFVDEDYLDCMRIELIDGRGFDRDFNDTLSVVINETAARDLRLDKAVDSRLITNDNNILGGRDEATFFQVIGLVRDFHFQSLHQPITPLFFVLNRNPDGANNLLSVRLGEGDLPGAIRRIEALWTRMAPDQPFKFSFLDRDLDKLYQGEQIAQRVFGLFALLAVFIACLGLFGLAAYLTRLRTKEIGVRKVLGAGMGQIVSLLSRDFLRLVLLALLIATPVAWYAMRRWLEGFAYHTGLHWWIFVAAGLIALAVAFLTVSWQALRAAMVNPAEALRDE
jgi:putative ABC transport system permease protein